MEPIINHDLMRLLDILIDSSFSISKPNLDNKREALDELKEKYPAIAGEVFYAATRIASAKRMYFSNPLRNITEPNKASNFSKALLNQILKTGKSNVRELTIPSDKKRTEDKKPNQEEFDFRHAALVYLLIQKINFLSERGELDILCKPLLNQIAIVTIQNIKMLAVHPMQYIYLIMKGQKQAPEKIIKFIEYLYTEYCNLCTEHPGKIYDESDNPKRMRIYINTPYTIDTLNFVADYSAACLTMGLDFDMKAFDKNEGSLNNDRLILYTSIKDLPDRLKIIELLAIKYPEFKSSLGSPLPNCAYPFFPLSGSNLPFYGICHNGTFTTSRDRKMIYANTLTYNSYIDMLADAAYLRIVGEYALAKNSNMDVRERSIIKSFVELADYKSDPENLTADRNHISQGTFSGYTYTQISNAITPYIEEAKSYILGKINKDDDEYCRRFNQTLQEIHNILQGFSKEDSANIAIDTFYTRSEQEKTKLLANKIKVKLLTYRVNSRY